MTVRDFIGTLFNEDYADFFVLKLRRQEKLVGVKLETNENNGRNCIVISETDDDFTCGEFYKGVSMLESWDCVVFEDEIVDEKEVYLEFNLGNLEIEWL